VSGEELEVLGKVAATKWREGACETLTDAVVTTVKHAALSPEQVRRVVEFTNTDAFLAEFKKEGGTHKVIEFAGGPANPSEVLKDLNDGGGGTVFDRGLLDYNDAPTEIKIASDHEADLRALFGVDMNLPYAEPLQDVFELQDKLAAAMDMLDDTRSTLERTFVDLQECLYQEVKQASLRGHSLGNIANVLALGAPDAEYVKIAFEAITPRLLQEGVFTGVHEALASMDKTASRQMLNRAHPMVTQMLEFSDCLYKLAHTRVAREELQSAHAETARFIAAGGTSKVAAGTVQRLFDAAAEGAERAAKPLGETAQSLKRTLLGGTGERTRDAVETAVKHAPHAAVAVGGLMAARRAMNNPTLARARYHAKAELMPWTDEYKYETARQRGEIG
jgi:hypothetical protein